MVDADDDDAALLRSIGDVKEAEAFERLARCWLPDADAVLAASPVDAAGIAAGAGIDDVAVVPNSVRVPERLGSPPGADRLLFVGNLTYAPNRDAARVLACDVLPMVRRQRPGATLELVGPHDDTLSDLPAHDGVTLTGAVPEVAPHYEHADVVVTPLRHGAGTRIKVLEAFAHRRPVVATATAVAGLDAEPGREAVVVSDDTTDALRTRRRRRPGRPGLVTTDGRPRPRVRHRSSRHRSGRTRRALRRPRGGRVSDERPERADGLESYEVDDGLVVYQAASDRVHYLNPTASVVYELCTGNHTEAEIVALVGEVWGLAEPPTEEVQRCLADLRTEGVVA